MRFMITFLTLLFTTLCTLQPAHAGFKALNGNTDLKIFNTIRCSTGVTCSKYKGGMLLVANGSTTGPIVPSAGMTVSSGQWKNWGRRADSLTGGTSTTPAATSVFVSQVFVHANAALTGIKLNNGGTCGTNKWIAVLFNSAGVPVANSALAGVLCTGSSTYQALPFTATYNVVGPGVYWIGLYADGATDRFYSVPASGEASGLAGVVTGTTFGTVASIVLPTTFTADKGPIAFTY